MKKITRVKELYSIKTSIQEVEPMLREFQSVIGFSEDLFHNLLVALTEAVNNALIHGNKLNSAKLVKIKLHFENNIIECEISDEGNGFNPENVPDPRNPENLLKDNGRGVFLIKNLSFKSEYKSDEKGTTLKIYFENK